MWPGFDFKTRLHMWVEFVVGSLLAPRGFSPGTPVFPFSRRPTSLNSNSIRNQRATGLSVARLLGVNLIKQINLTSFLFFYRTDPPHYFDTLLSNHPKIFPNVHDCRQIKISLINIILNNFIPIKYV